MGGVVAAGHPLTAGAGAEVLRAGGNAVDAAVAAMLTSVVVEPMMTGLGGGGYLMVSPPDAEPVLLDFFVEAPGRGADPADRAALRTVEVSSARPAGLPGRRGVLRGVRRAGRRGGRGGPLRHGAAGRAGRAGRGPLARAGVPVNEQQAEIVHAAGADPALRPPRRGRRTWWTGGRRWPARWCATWSSPTRWSGSAPRARRRSTPVSVGAAVSDCVLAARRAADSGRSRRVPGGGAGADEGGVPRAGGVDQPATERRRGAAGVRAGDARTGPRDRRTTSRWSGRWRRRRRARTVGFFAGLPAPGFGPASSPAASARPRTSRCSTARAGRASVTCSNGEGSGVLVPGTGVHVNNMMGEQDLSPRGFFTHPPGRRLPSMMAPTVVRRDGQASWCSARPARTGSAARCCR